LTILNFEKIQDENLSKKKIDENNKNIQNEKQTNFGNGVIIIKRYSN